MAEAQEIEVGDENFDEKVIQQSKEIPVVVDFWAGWCMPCLMLSPIMEKLVRLYKGKFILAKANIDDAPLFAQKYKVMSIPSVKLFKDGKITAEFTGALPEEEVKEWLEKEL